MKKSDIMQHATLLNQRSEQVRQLLPRGFRRLVVLVLAVVLAISLVATVAAIRPFAVTLPTPLFAYSQTITPAYSINLTPNAQFGETSLPAGRIYLRDYVESVAARFDIGQRAFWFGNLTSRSQVEAILQIFSAQNPSVLLMERKSPLLPTEDAAPTLTAQNLSRTVTVPLAAYRETAAAFLKESGMSGNAILTIRLTTDIAGSRFGQAQSSQQTADIAVPLSADSFQIGVTPASTRRLVARPIRYLVQSDTLPMFVYPLASVLLLLVMVLFLALTANRPVYHFQRKLKRLLRLGRRQILMIADKAWEPEWCVTVSNFRSMVQTARRLRHPIFCYIDNDAEHPAAYFYVYYGENNYCYVFDGKPEAKIAAQPVQGLSTPGELASASARYPESVHDSLAAPVLTHAASALPNRGAAGALGAVGAAGAAGNTAPFAVGGANEADTLAGDPSARFQTAPFKLTSADPGTASGTVIPSAAGPMMPSPEPYLDLIRDPWHGDQVADEADQPVADIPTAKSWRPWSAPTAISGRTAAPATKSDNAAPPAATKTDNATVPTATNTDNTTAPTATKTDNATVPAADQNAAASTGRKADDDHGPVPILPETDASFFRSSLF